MFKFWSADLESYGSKNKSVLSQNLDLRNLRVFYKNYSGAAKSRA